MAEKYEGQRFTRVRHLVALVVVRPGREVRAAGDIALVDWHLRARAEGFDEGAAAVRCEECPAVPAVFTDLD